jgi:hypothetical protein
LLARNIQKPALRRPALADPTSQVASTVMTIAGHCQGIQPVHRCLHSSRVGPSWPHGSRLGFCACTVSRAASRSGVGGFSHGMCCFCGTSCRNADFSCGVNQRAADSVNYQSLLESFLFMPHLPAPPFTPSRKTPHAPRKPATSRPPAGRPGQPPERLGRGVSTSTPKAAG